MARSGEIPRAVVELAEEAELAFTLPDSNHQLDKLGERLKQGNLDRAVMVALSGYRNRFIESTEAVARRIAETKRPYGLDITQRPAKSTSSIIAKLQRESIRLSQIQDIGGLRLICSKRSVQEKAIELVLRLYPAARVVDRRDRPQHGYRAVHLIVRHGDCTVEIQVRTKLQNLWAQFSEKLADLHGNEIKYGGGQPEALRSLAALSRIVGQIESLEARADAQKPAMNALQKKRRQGELLTREETLNLGNYEGIRKGIRDFRGEWLRYLAEATAS